MHRWEVHSNVHSKASCWYFGDNWVLDVERIDASEPRQFLVQRQSGATRVNKIANVQ